MKKLVIIGAGGHGKVIADIALKNGYTDIAFVDDAATGSCMGFPIVGTCADLQDDGATDFVIAIGNNAVRRRVAERHRLPYVTLVHPSAQIAVQVKLGEGTVVMAGAAINPAATVGVHGIINTGAVIEHDNVLGDFVHVSPHATLCGTVSVGDGTHIGAGATVRNNLTVSGGCVIGVGAAVVSDIHESGTYIGVPAKRMGR